MAKKYYNSRHQRKNREPVFLSQILVCVAITAIVFAIKSLKTDTTQKISGHIENTLYYNVDVKETFSEIKDLLNDIKKEVKKHDNAKENEIKSTATPDNI